MDDNKALLRRFFDEAWHQKNLAIADAVFAEAYVLHDPGNRWIAPGPAGIREMVAAYNEAFPDARFTIELQLAQADLVVTRWVVRSTHRGELRGVAPSGLVSTTSGILFSRVSDGKIQEEWTEWNKQGLIDQLVSANGADDELERAFPDRRTEAVLEVRELDLLATRVIWRATHAHPYRGILPAGHTVEVGEHRIQRLDPGGSVVQQWIERDTEGLLRQLGVDALTH